jgi:hypothetical protein
MSEIVDVKVTVEENIIKDTAKELGYSINYLSDSVSIKIPNSFRELIYKNKIFIYDDMDTIEVKAFISKCYEKDILEKSKRKGFKVIQKKETTDKIVISLKK